MSYSDAPPRQGRSPAFYIGIGCLALFGIVVVGVIILGLGVSRIVKDAQKAAKTPVPIETVVAGLKDVPVYPGAKYEDTTSTRAARAAMGMTMKAMKTARAAEMAQFSVSDPPEKTLTWYDAKLKAVGYTLSNTTTNEHRGRDEDAGPVKTYTHSYRKDKTVVVAQYSLPEDAKSGRLMLMRFDGISGNFRAGSFGGGSGVTTSTDSTDK